MIEKLIFGAVCFIVFLNFGLSIFNVFVANDKHQKLGYNLLKLGNILTWLGSFYLVYSVAEIRQMNFMLGTLIQLFCLGLFLYLKSLMKKKLTIAFSLDQPQYLFKIGPYKYIRHPFYLCYLLSYLSVAIAMPHWISFSNFIVMALVYFWAARLEEQKFNNSHLNQEYLHYKSEAGMFWPVFRK